MTFASPTVSVIVPTRNRSRLLALTLASALDQWGVELEVIVVDEGSTDDTMTLLNQLGDPRVRVIQHAVPLGKSAARNHGIAEARGEWIAFLDDDDIWAPDKLHLQLQALRATGRTWAYTGAVNITTKHRVIGGAPPASPDQVAESLHRTNAVPGGCSSVVVHVDALPPEGFDGRYRLCEDWDLWIRISHTGLPACVPGPLVGYRLHSENSSADTARLLAELEMIEEQHGGPVDRVTFYRHLARVCLRANRQGGAFAYYCRAAALPSRSYVVGGFVPDLMEVFVSIFTRVRRRFGGPERLSNVRYRTDPHGAWKQEAQIWLDQFERRHATMSHRPIQSPVA